MTPLAMARPKKFKCDSCIRYSKKPLWGHRQCSAHRPCCKEANGWNPRECPSCTKHLSVLDLASDSTRRDSIGHLRKMLERTKRSKADQGNAHWQFQQLLDNLVQAYDIRRDNQSGPISPREESITPASEARMIREDIASPISEYNSVILSIDQGSVREGLTPAEVQSVSGSSVQASVREALDEQTRDYINEGLYLEQNGIRYANNRYELPNNQSSAQNRVFRNGQFVNPMINYGSKPIGQRQSLNHFNPPAGPSSRKRNFAELTNTHNYQNIVGNPQGNILYNDVFMGQRDNFDPTNYEDDLMPEQNVWEDGNGGLNESLNIATGPNQMLDPILEGESEYVIDENDHLPWIRFNPNKHISVDDRRINMWTTKGRQDVEVFRNPQDRSLFRTKSNTTKIKNIPYFLGSGLSNMLTKAHPEITISEVENSNKEVKLLDANIKPESRMSFLCELLKKNTSAVTKATMLNDTKQVRHCFPNHTFGIQTVVNFNQGWTLNGGEGQYSDWVKDKNLSIDDVWDELDFVNQGDTKITIPIKKLNEERETRKVLSSLLTALFINELESDKTRKVSDDIKMKYNLSHESNIAAARLVTPALEYIARKWFRAKVEVRRSVLKNWSLESVVRLTKSNPWTPLIFPKETLEEIRLNKFNNQTKRVLGLTNPKPFDNPNPRPPPQKKRKQFNPIQYQNQDFGYQQYQNRIQNQGNRQPQQYQESRNIGPNNVRANNNNASVSNNASYNKPMQSNNNSGSGKRGRQNNNPRNRGGKRNR